MRGGRPQPHQAQFWAGIIPPVVAQVKVPSYPTYPMQDEPEGEVRFQHKMSPAQVTRLIARYRKSRSLQAAPYRRHRFPQRNTRADIELLATVDEAHENLSGPATRRILERECCHAPLLMLLVTFTNTPVGESSGSCNLHFI